MDFNQKRAKVFYGWYIVGACFLIALYTAGVTRLGFTAVFEPIANEFGWSYAQISLAASLQSFEFSLLLPIMGLIVDRWGPRRLIFGGGILICMGLILLSRVSFLAMFYGAYTLIAIGVSTCAPSVLMAAVGNWFRRKAGIAIGILSSGFGLAGILVPIMTGLIDALQWRTAIFTVGLGMLVIVLPLSLLVRHKPEHYGYHPDGDTDNAVEISGSHTATVSAEISIPVKQVLSNRTFWNVAFASMCHAFVTGTMTVHIMPYLSSLGIARSVSSLVALVLPVVSICGRLGSGWLSDRLDGRHVFAAAFALMTAGLFLFEYITQDRMWLLAPFIIIFSLGWGGGVTTRIALLREYFGRSAFGTILGFTWGIMMVGHIAGIPLAGWVFDTWGSYQGTWLSYGTITIVGMVLALTIPSSSSTTQLSSQPEIQQAIK
ncbi:MFS transporter [Chloroflexota bacterium]